MAVREVDYAVADSDSRRTSRSFTLIKSNTFHGGSTEIVYAKTARRGCKDTVAKQCVAKFDRCKKMLILDIIHTRPPRRYH